MRATAIRSPAPAGRSPAPEPQATPKQAGILNRRPQAVAQRKLAEFIHRSPRVVAQAKREADLLALPAQRTAAPGNQPTHRIPHGPEEDETLQLKTDAGATAPVPAQLKSNPNRTGMPDRLKAGIESLSGVDMSDVRVHANSDKPAQLNALAYAQGSDIHLGPGQRRPTFGGGSEPNWIQGNATGRRAHRP